MHIDLRLREEFRKSSLSGTTVNFRHSGASKGALQISATDFLKITYPSYDLLKMIEGASPKKAQPIVLLGARGQGKSHLMAALWHLCKDHEAGKKWLNEWAEKLEDRETAEQIVKLNLRENFEVIAEMLHHQQYKYLWNILFERHPFGEAYKGVWKDRKTAVPSYKDMIGMFSKKPTVLILDEFQTWFESLQFKHHVKTAFNFIQILSEIAQNEPDKLVLVVSIRDGNSEAYKQIRRVNPIHIDFKSQYAKRDRRRLLLHRLFENRRQVLGEDIAKAVEVHVDEYFRLFKIPEQDHEKEKAEFIEAFPFSPKLLRLLDDQVLMAAEAQETRDLIRFLVDLFKHRNKSRPVITAADFSLTNSKSNASALLDSIANKLLRDLREKAIRNFEALQDVRDARKSMPHAKELMSALWLRSMVPGNLQGAEPRELQLDITGKEATDPNAFQEELAMVVDNSFNIHRVGDRLVFQQDENPRTKLLANARNDRLFEKGGDFEGEDIQQLAKELRFYFAGSEETSGRFRVIVLKKNWRNAPWNELDKSENLENADSRLPMIVFPECPAEISKMQKMLGAWLKEHVSENRNTLRYILPSREKENLYEDQQLLIIVRAIFLGMKWGARDKTYERIARNFREKKLLPKLKNRFEGFAILRKWNFQKPEECEFDYDKHKKHGEKIPEAVERFIQENLFQPEEFEKCVLEKFAKNSRSIGDLLDELKGTQGGECIPWLGEAEIRERVLKLCAKGVIDLKLQNERLQRNPSEDYEANWNRMKQKPVFKNEITILIPIPVVISPPPPSDPPNPIPIPNPPSNPIPPIPNLNPIPIPNPNPTSSTSNPNLISQNPISISKNSPDGLREEIRKKEIVKKKHLRSVKLKIDKISGEQLEDLLKVLPDRLYGLDFEVEGE